MPTPAKKWKTHPAYFVMLELLQKKNSMNDQDLLEAMNEEFGEISQKEFNKLLMRLEISGKIRTTSMVRGKRQIELVV